MFRPSRTAGEVAGAAGKEDQALEAYRRATAAAPERPEAWEALAQLAKDRKNADLVIEANEKLVRAEPGCGAAVLGCWSRVKAWPGGWRPWRHAWPECIQSSQTPCAPCFVCVVSLPPFLEPLACGQAAAPAAVFGKGG